MKEFCSMGKVEGKSAVLDAKDHMEEETAPDKKGIYFYYF